jgi:tRNA threonylcarbamoyladenosine biosynthesis protein TsaB
MNLLAIDTSTEHPSIALAKGPEIWVDHPPRDTKTSATLIPLILKGLDALSLSFSTLDALVYTKGPGAFTGLRTAVSIAQGFSLAHSLPTVGFSTLMTLAQCAREMGHTHRRMICALDARMQQVYWSAYEWRAGRWSCLKPPSIESEQASLWPKPFEDSLDHEPALMVGNALAVKTRQPLSALMPNTPLEWCVCEPQARALLSLGRQHFSSPEPNHPLDPLDPAKLGLPAPWYLRDQVAQTTLERALARVSATRVDPLLTGPQSLSEPLS